MSTLKAAPWLVILALATSGCFGQRCVEVFSGWTYPEYASDGTRNMMRYRATTFTVCRPLVEFR